MSKSNRILMRPNLLDVRCRLGDPEALLWSQASGSGAEAPMLPTVLAHSGAESDKSSVVECMDWQSAGTMLATGSMDGWVRVWNKSGQPCSPSMAVTVQLCASHHTGAVLGRLGMCICARLQLHVPACSPTHIVSTSPRQLMFSVASDCRS